MVLGSGAAQNKPHGFTDDTQHVVGRKGNQVLVRVVATADRADGAVVCVCGMHGAGDTRRSLP